MPELTPEGRKIVDELAQRHGVSRDAVTTLLAALAAGHGSQAQFNHPELGGMGQWSPGMVMVGDMFNHGLKARVDALCSELARLLNDGTLIEEQPLAFQSQAQSQGGTGRVSLSFPGLRTSGAWWPAELGAPSSTGAQNDLRYAVFPSARRLAIARGGQVAVYDTADHRITGFSQQQGADQSLTFTSQRGLVRVADLAVVPTAPPGVEHRKAQGPHTGVPAPTEEVREAAPPPGPPADIFAMIERLADLRQKALITEQEFEAKKTELLARL
jgi:hypothetical protein